MSAGSNSGADLSRLRQINEWAILGAVREVGPLRLAGIAARTGLSRAPIEEVVRGLVERGWLVEEAPVVAGRGRPARQYRFRAEAGYLLGLDIGGYNIRAAVADLNGQVLANAHAAATPMVRSEKRLALVADVIERCLAEAGAGADQVWSTGAGSTGWIDRDGHVVLSSAIPDWAGVDLADRLTGMVAGITAVENDSRLACLAEQRRGVARGVDDVVYLHAGRRTGIGLIIAGRLHGGFGGVAGDFSLMPTLKWESATDYLSQSASATVRTRPGDRLTQVFGAARRNDRGALSAVRRYVRQMGLAAAAAVSMVDPEMLVLGGSLAQWHDVLLPLLHQELELTCLRVPQLRASTFGAEAVALGGVCLALDQLESRLRSDDGLSGELVPPVGARRQASMAP